MSENGKMEPTTCCFITPVKNKDREWLTFDIKIQAGYYLEKFEPVERSYITLVIKKGENENESYDYNLIDKYKLYTRGFEILKNSNGINVLVEHEYDHTCTCHDHDDDHDGHGIEITTHTAGHRVIDPRS